MDVLLVRLLILIAATPVVWATYRALTGRPRWYWIAALLLYLFSVPFAWSIGALLRAGTFMLIGAGTAHLLRTSPSPALTAAAAALGLLAWAVWFFLGDITWAFLPILYLIG